MTDEFTWGLQTQPDPFGLAPTLSGCLGQINLNYRKGILLAAFLIANILTGHKIQTAGELWQNSSKLSPLSRLCPSPASFTRWLSGFGCILREMMFLVWDCPKSEGSQSAQASFPTSTANNTWPKWHCHFQDCRCHCAGALLELTAKDHKELIIWSCMLAHS